MFSHGHQLKVCNVCNVHSFSNNNLSIHLCWWGMWLHCGGTLGWSPLLSKDCDSSPFSLHSPRPGLPGDAVGNSSAAKKRLWSPRERERPFHWYVLTILFYFILINLMIRGIITTWKARVSPGSPHRWTVCSSSEEYLHSPGEGAFAYTGDDIFFLSHFFFMILGHTFHFVYIFSLMLIYFASL